MVNDVAARSGYGVVTRSIGSEKQCCCQEIRLWFVQIKVALARSVQLSSAVELGKDIDDMPPQAQYWRVVVKEWSDICLEMTL